MSKQLKPFSLTLAWGQRDEGQYHWAGQAANLTEATRLAREEMDSSYNGEYCNGPKDDGWKRGLEGEDKTTEYVVSDYSEGANEFAAPDMLAALQRVADVYILDDADQKMVDHAIARGEGRA